MRGEKEAEIEGDSTDPLSRQVQIRTTFPCPSREGRGPKVPIWSFGQSCDALTVMHVFDYKNSLGRDDECQVSFQVYQSGGPFSSENAVAVVFWTWLQLLPVESRHAFQAKFRSRFASLVCPPGHKAPMWALSKQHAI